MSERRMRVLADIYGGVLRIGIRMELFVTICAVYQNMMYYNNNDIWIIGIYTRMS